MQVEDHTKSKCPTCGAGRGEPCITEDGYVAERVHYGRPYWSAKVGKPPDEPEFTFRDERPNVRTEPHPLGGVRLFADSDQCAECGEDLNGYGFLARCAQFHVKGKLRR